MLDLRAPLVTALLLAASPLAAQTGPAAVAQGDAVAASAEPPALTFGTQSAPSRTLIFTGVAGLKAAPAYFGADELTLGPLFRINVGFLNFAGFSYGDRDISDDPYDRPRGFGVRGSFRFIGERNAEDFDELEGLDDIDPTLEVGVGFGYVWPNAEVFADARYGIGGSDSWVGELGANFVARPTDRLALRVGPRFLYGADNYNETYFGVSEDEAARSGFDAYAPDGGLVSAGVEFIATYRFTDRWWLEGGARYDRFQGDAADSPIVRQGSDESTEIRIGIRRAFVLEF